MEERTQRELELLNLVDALQDDLKGAEKTLGALRAQYFKQIADYKDMAEALLNAFVIEGGVIKIANEDAAREAFRIADIYFS